MFRVQSGKKLHRTEKIYTDAVCGVCDKYEVCKWHPQVVSDPGLVEIIPMDLWIFPVKIEKRK